MMDMHPISQLLPEMSDSELQQLSEDIKTNGLRNPMTLYEGKILDGRHRYLACQQAGVDSRFEDFNGDDDTAVAFVYSQNLARRQLSKSQLAMAGANLKAWHAEQAKERQKLSKGRGKKGVVDPPHLLGKSEEGKARDHAAKAVGVGGRLMDKAVNATERFRQICRNL